MFSLVMTVPLDLEQDHARVGALVGMMLGLGYLHREAWFPAESIGEDRRRP